MTFYRLEQAARKAQAEYATRRRQQTADKISARAFTRAYLEPLLPDTYEQLMARGYFYDGTLAEIEKFFYNKMVDESLQAHTLDRMARTTVDGVIREVGNQNLYEGFRSQQSRCITHTKTDLLLLNQ